MTHEQLTAAGLNVFPCSADKSPAIKTDWKIPTQHNYWPTGVIGVAVPMGAVVIDLDTYKGITREAVERTVGCALPWDLALIQSTMNGGQHYAFRTSHDVRQGSNLLGLKGLDTRVGGKGYICTGQSYTVYGGGVIRLAAPGSLPELPSGVVELLSHVAATPSTVTQPPADMADIIAALKYLDPAQGRDVWLKVGQSLASVTDDPTLYDQWSSGALNGVDMPHNYDQGHLYHQWPSMKGDGRVNISSLFYMAIQAGWSPRQSLDTTSAFSPAETNLFAEIEGLGAVPEHTARLTAACAGNKHLLAALNRQLKEAGLLTKAVKADLDDKAGGSGPYVQGEYGKNHYENATLFMARRAVGNPLAYSDETWYEYNGKAWEERDKDSVTASLTRDMGTSTPQLSNILGSLGVLKSLAGTDRRVNEESDRLILFQNGVLDMGTGVLNLHTSELFTTHILPFDYIPTAAAANWNAFLAGSLPDRPGSIALLQEWFGYMMSSQYDHHKIMFLLGAGRGGKGILGRVLKALVGPYNYTACDLGKFAEDSFLDSLRTATVAFDGDVVGHIHHMREPQVTSTLKKISGNDDITFGRKYKGNITQKLPTRITLAGNSIPTLFDASGALFNRMLLVPFDVSFLGKEDRDLEARIMQELPGIAIWALEGLRRLNTTRAFTCPPEAQGDLDMLKDAYSPLHQFMDSVFVTTDPLAVVSTKQVYVAYREWAASEGEPPPGSHARLTRDIKAATRGAAPHHTDRYLDGVKTKVFTGLALRDIVPTVIKPKLGVVK